MSTLILETAFVFLIISKCLVIHAALSSVSAIPLSWRPSECMNTQMRFQQTLTSLDVKALRHRRNMVYLHISQVFHVFSWLLWGFTGDGAGGKHTEKAGRKELKSKMEMHFKFQNLSDNIYAKLTFCTSASNVLNDKIWILSLILPLLESSPTSDYSGIFQPINHVKLGWHE